MSVDLERARDGITRISGYCDRIAFHMHRFGGRKEFLKDWSYQDSCIMILAQIGEEAKKIEPWLTASRPDYDWKSVIRFRDFAYHNYPSTNYEIVWEIISKDIPELMNILSEITNAGLKNPDDASHSKTSLFHKKREIPSS